MSTAGKVLVVLVMLVAIVCMILAGGIARLNYNANQRLDQLSKDVAKAQEEIEATRLEIMDYSDQASSAGEKIDRDVTTLRAQQTDLERTRAQIVDTLEALKYDLDRENKTGEAAKESLRIRVAEFEAEEKAMADLRQHVQTLKSNNSELMGRLEKLRNDLLDTNRKNVQMLGKRR
jgi:chromosome segregation ATPase